MMHRVRVRMLLPHLIRSILLRLLLLLLGITTTTWSFIGNVGAIADAVLLDVHLPLKSPTNEWQQECPYSQALESNRILRHYFAQTGERVDFFTPLHKPHVTLFIRLSLTWRRIILLTQMARRSILPSLKSF